MQHERCFLSRIFALKRDEILGSKLHNEELHNLYSLPSIIRMVKSMRMRWAWYVACMAEKRNACRVWGESQKGDLDVGGRLVLK
jgi:hypothetical protein